MHSIQIYDAPDQVQHFQLTKSTVNFSATLEPHTWPIYLQPRTNRARDVTASAENPICLLTRKTFTTTMCFKGDINSTRPQSTVNHTLTTISTHANLQPRRVRLAIMPLNKPSRPEEPSIRPFINVSSPHTTRLLMHAYSHTSINGRHTKNRMTSTVEMKKIKIHMVDDACKVFSPVS